MNFSELKLLQKWPNQGLAFLPEDSDEISKNLFKVGLRKKMALKWKHYESVATRIQYVSEVLFIKRIREGVPSLH